MIKIGAKLGLICAIAALCLGAVNMVTEPRIKEARAAKIKNALEQLSPGGSLGTQTAVEDPVVKGYYEIKTDGVVSSYILNLKGAGYGGDLIILASYLSDGSLYKSVLMENDETPGLGKEAEKDGYMDMYYGKIKEKIPSIKSQLESSEADAISGATITFSGIGQALASGSDYVISLEGK